MIRNDREGARLEAPQEDKRHRRSVSQLSSFSRCGESYRLEKIEKAPRRPAAWLLQGIGFHTATQMWENTLREMPRSEVLDIYFAEYDRLYQEELAKEPDISRWLAGGRNKPENDIPRRRERGAEQVTGYMDYAEQAPERPWMLFDEVPALEIEFELDFDGIRVVGFIDQVIQFPDGGIIPRDLKTGTKQPDWDIQLGVYGLALREEFGLDVHFGDFYMAKNNAPLPMVSLERFDREYLTNLFKNLDAGIQAGAFVPNPGNACGTCAVSDYCSAIGSKSAEFPYRRTIELPQPAAVRPADRGNGLGEW